MNENNQLDTAFQAGQQAYRQTRPLIDNPHGDRSETPVSEAWKRGWLGQHDLAMLDLKERKAAASLVAPAGVPRPQRYDLVTNYRCGDAIEEMEPSDEGEWVRYDELESQSSATGRLPALEALLKEWRQVVVNWKQLDGVIPGAGFNAACFETCADELEKVLAGLRADPAPRQLLEEQDVTSRGDGS